MWHWTTITGDLGSALNSVMKALEQELKDISKYMTSQAKARTTDATVTTLFTAKIPVNESVLVSGVVIARRTGGAAGATNDGAAYRVEFGAKNSAGVAALIGGAGVVTVLGEDQAAWTVTLVVSGGNILVRVTGAANNSVVWSWSGRSLSVAS